MKKKLEKIILVVLIVSAVLSIICFCLLGGYLIYMDWR